jgi:hypothetical protein
MVEREPVRIAAEDADLISLATELSRFAIVRLSTPQQFADSVWFTDQTGSTGAIWAESRDVIDWFEVFPLVVRRDLAPPESLDWKSWPFNSWRVDVLRRMDWLMKSAVQPDDPPLGHFGSGEAPPNAHRQLVDVGLLFTGDRGDRLLVASDDFPLAMVVTSVDHEIDAYLSNCATILLPDYVREPARSGLTPSQTP